MSGKRAREKTPQRVLSPKRIIRGVLTSSAVFSRFKLNSTQLMCYEMRSENTEALKKCKLKITCARSRRKRQRVCGSFYKCYLAVAVEVECVYVSRVRVLSKMKVKVQTPK